MTAREKSQLLEILTQHCVRDCKRILEASQDIDRMRRKVKGPSSVEIIQRFRGPI